MCLGQLEGAAHEHVEVEQGGVAWVVNRDRRARQHGDLREIEIRTSAVCEQGSRRMFLLVLGDGWGVLDKAAAERQGETLKAAKSLPLVFGSLKLRRKHPRGDEGVDAQKEPPRSHPRRRRGLPQGYAED